MEMNHPTTKVTSDAPTVNNAELDSLEGVEDAFAYLGDDYNDGHITRNLGGDRVLLISRYNRLEHFDALMDAHAEGFINVEDAQVVTHQGERRLKVQVAEGERDA